jgi:hypothetical protein
MMKWTTFLASFIALILVISFSCKSNNHHKYKDSFYNGDYDFDVKRLPLIRPYVSLQSPVDTSFWLCDLRTNNISYTSSANGEQFYVSKEFIVIACSNKCFFDGQLTDSVFYLMTPKDSLEYAFKTKRELNRKVDSLFGVKDVELKDFNSVYKQYHKTGKLPWLSDDD